MSGHVFTGFIDPIARVMQGVDELFKQKVAVLKYAQFVNPNNMHNKIRIVQSISARVMNENEGIDSSDSVAEVLSSLFYDHICLRLLNVTSKAQLFEDINKIIKGEFGISSIK